MAQEPFRALLVLQALATELVTAIVQARVHKRHAIVITRTWLLAHLAVGLRRLQAVAWVYCAYLPLLAVAVSVARQLAVVKAVDARRRARKTLRTWHTCSAAASSDAGHLCALGWLRAFVAGIANIQAVRLPWVLAIIVIVTLSATRMVHATLGTFVHDVGVAKVAVFRANTDSLLALICVGLTRRVTMAIRTLGMTWLMAGGLLRAFVTLWPRISAVTAIANTCRVTTKRLVLAMYLLAIVIQRIFHHRAFGALVNRTEGSPLICAI